MSIEKTTEQQVIWPELSSPPNFKWIKYEHDTEYPKVVYVTLNRPDKNNAISIGPTEMTGELKEAFRLVNQIDECKVVIVQGAGRNFCATTCSTAATSAKTKSTYSKYSPALRRQ